MICIILYNKTLYLIYNNNQTNHHHLDLLPSYQNLWSLYLLQHSLNFLALNSKNKLNISRTIASLYVKISYLKLPATLNSNNFSLGYPSQSLIVPKLAKIRNAINCPGILWWYRVIALRLNFVYMYTFVYMYLAWILVPNRWQMYVQQHK